MNDSESGYDLGIFVTDPGLKFQCGVCLNFLKDPYQCKNGHCFCLECFKIVLVRTPRCPMCMIPANISTISRSLFVKDAVDELQTVCISCTNVPQNTSAGCCKWVGSLVHRQSHYDNECEFVLSPCCFMECKAQVPRKLLEQHTAECEHGAPSRSTRNKEIANSVLRPILYAFIGGLILRFGRIDLLLSLLQWTAHCLQSWAVHVMQHTYVVTGLIASCISATLLAVGKFLLSCVRIDLLLSLLHWTAHCLQSWAVHVMQHTYVVIGLIASCISATLLAVGKFLLSCVRIDLLLSLLQWTAHCLFQSLFFAFYLVCSTVWAICARNVATVVLITVCVLCYTYKDVSEFLCCCWPVGRVVDTKTHKNKRFVRENVTC
jgi:hypothetical protein